MFRAGMHTNNNREAILFWKKQKNILMGNKQLAKKYYYTFLN